MKRFLCAVMASIMLFTAGCGAKKDSNETSKVSGESTSEVSGEQIYDSFLAGDPETIDAQKGSDVYGNAIVNNIYEPLLRSVQNEDNTLKIEEAGAQSYEISDDGKVYTFHIRDNMTWEDGKPLTAKDYEYGIKRSADPNTASGMAFLLADMLNFDEVNKGEKDLDELGVKAIDDKTLEITLSHPAQYFLNIVPFRVCFPQREDIVEAEADAFGSEADTVIGCGPFKLTNRVHNSMLTLEKSDTYRDKDKVNLQTVNLRILTDINAVMNAFQAREIMSASTNLPEWTEKLNAMENIKTADMLLPSMDYITPNQNDELFKNEKVRQAFNIAIDREGLNQTVSGGAATPAYYRVPSAISLNEINYREVAGEPLKTVMEEYKDPKALLEEGLSELGKGKPEDIEVSLIITTSPLLKKTGEYIQENLQQKLGVKVNLEFMEWPILANRVESGDYQMAFLARFADFNNPNAMLSLFTSSASAVNTGWKSEEYDKLITEAASEADDKKAAEIYKKAEELLMDQAVIYPLTTGKTTLFYQDKVNNININQFSTAGYKYISLKN